MKPILRLIDDSDFLIAHKRYKSALSLLLIAVAASAKKMFPSGTSSIDNPATKPGKFCEIKDSERFIRFLGPRIRKLSNPFVQEDGRHIRLMQYHQDSPNPENIIYHLYRNPLIHEGDILGDSPFDPVAEPSIDKFGVEIQDGKITISMGLLPLLRWAVSDAPINGVDFGVNHFRLRLKNSIEATQQQRKDIALDLVTSPGRVTLLLAALVEIGPAALVANDQELKHLFNHSRRARAGQTGLRNLPGQPSFCDAFGELTAHGIFSIRRLFEDYEYIDIAT